MGKLRLRVDKGAAAEGSWWGVAEKEQSPALWPPADFHTHIGLHTVERGEPPPSPSFQPFRIS